MSREPRDLHRSRAASSTTYSTHAAAAWKATVGWLLVGAGLLGWCLGPAVVVATAKASGTELTSIAKIALVTTHERKTHRCAPASDVAGRPARLLPSILLIGERKCGTSSLARYLAMHSHVLPPETKEPAYLNRPQTSRSAYALHFPLVGALQSCMNWFELAKTGRITSEPVCKVAASDCPPLTFDASAGYFSEVPPHVAFSLVPRARALVLLRAPHLRALSHWRMHMRFKREGRRRCGTVSCDSVTNFSHQIDGELKRLAPGHGAKGSYAPQTCTLARCPYTPYIGPGLLYEPRVALWTAHGNPLKVLLTEELDEATAKGPRALADYLAPTLQWCGLEPSLMGPLLNMREPLRSNVASWVAVTAAEGPPAATHATLQLLLRLYEQSNHVLAQRLGRSSLPKEWASIPGKR